MPSRTTKSGKVYGTYEDIQPQDNGLSTSVSTPQAKSSTTAGKSKKKAGKVKFENTEETSTKDEDNSRLQQKRLSKKGAKGKSKIIEDISTEEEDDSPQQPKKSSKKAVKGKSKIIEDISTEEEDDSPQQPKKSSKKAAKGKSKIIEDISTEEEDDSPQQPKKSSKKAAKGKSKIIEDISTEDEDNSSQEYNSNLKETQISEKAGKARTLQSDAPKQFLINLLDDDGDTKMETWSYPTDQTQTAFNGLDGEDSPQDDVSRTRIKREESPQVIMPKNSRSLAREFEFGRQSTIERELHPIEQGRPKNSSPLRDAERMFLVRDPGLPGRLHSTPARIIGVTPRGELFVALKSQNKDHPGVERCYKIKGSDYPKEKSDYLENGGIRFISGNPKDLIGCKLHEFEVHAVAYDENERTASILGKTPWQENICYWSKSKLESKFGKRNVEAIIAIKMREVGQAPIRKKERTVEDIIQDLQRLKIEESD
ncbi:hypothetical protein V8F33_008494 [Rhypophila sp. PSN 637]